LYPWYEMGYAIYLAVLGLITTVSKKEAWN